jgi:hypothetical protein
MPPTLPDLRPTSYRMPCVIGVNGTGAGVQFSSGVGAIPLHSSPGQMKHETPPWLEQVPWRFWEQLSVPSLHRAVAVPHAPVAGAQRLG